MRFVKNDGGRKENYPKSTGKVGDCVVRAIAIATQKNYKDVLKDLCEYAIRIGAMPNSHHIYREYLKDNGWEETKFGKKLVRVTSSKIPKEDWVICFMSRHLCAIKGNQLHDIWDCSYKRVFRIYTKSK